MRFECSLKLSECNVWLSQHGWQTVPYLRSSNSEWAIAKCVLVRCTRHGSVSDKRSRRCPVTDTRWQSFARYQVTRMSDWATVLEQRKTNRYLPIYQVASKLDAKGGRTYVLRDILANHLIRSSVGRSDNLNLMVRICEIWGGPVTISEFRKFPVTLELNLK